MRKTISLKIEVVIGTIYVSKEGFYNFDFWLFENRKRIEYGNYDGSFSGRSASAFRKVLKRGYATRLVLGRYYS